VFGPPSKRSTAQTVPLTGISFFALLVWLAFRYRRLEERKLVYAF